MFNFLKKKSLAENTSKFVIINNNKYVNPFSKEKYVISLLDIAENSPVFYIVKKEKIGGVFLPTKKN